jgi:hypothetical protein
MAKGSPTSSAEGKWTSPGCARRRATAFCPTCGEEPLRPRDLKVDDLAARIFAALSSVDGKLMRRAEQ